MGLANRHNLELFSHFILLQMVILYEDPHGQKIFERRDSSTTVFSVSLSDVEREGMMELEKHCRDLETRLKQYEVGLDYVSSAWSEVMSERNRSWSCCLCYIVTLHQGLNFAFAYSN